MAISKTTYIQLYGDFINESLNAYLEIDEATAVPITFSVSDIRDVSERTGSYSKSIKIPGTKNNNKVLRHVFNTNITDVSIVNALSFNINRKQQCRIIQDGSVILDNAYMQLTNIDKVSKGMNQDEQVTYTIIVKDNIGNLFTSIGAKLLTDIDLGAGATQHSAYEIYNSWYYSYNAGDKYKYVLPRHDINNNFYYLNEFSPAIFTRTYVDNIINAARFSYEWHGVSDLVTRSTLIPYNGGPVGEVIGFDSSNATQYTSSGSTIQGITGPWINSIINTPVQIYLAAGATFNTTTMMYTNPYTLTSSAESLDWEITYNYALKIVNSNTYTIQVSTAGADISTYVHTTIDPSNATEATEYMNLVLNTSVLSGLTQYISVTGGILSPNQIVVFPTGLTVPGSSTSLVASGTNKQVLKLNDATYNSNYRYLAYIGDSIGSGTGWWTGLTVSGTASVSYLMEIFDVTIKIKPSIIGGFNLPIDLNSYIPSQIKQTDFLKSLFTMFNCYVINSRTTPNKIDIYSRDDFYDIGAVKDWSTKLNREKTCTVTLLPQITSKRLKLTYKQDDNDENLKAYLQSSKEVYGQVEFIYDNEFVSNVDTKELIFSPSILFERDQSTNAVTFGHTGPHIIKILYNTNQGFVSSCNTYKIINYNSGAEPSGSTGPAGMYNLNMNFYSLSAHTNAHYSSTQDIPNIDLNFGVNDYYFDTDLVPTTNNLGNQYWRRTVSQINNGRMFTAYFNLTPADISSMQLNDKIYVENQYWNINKILDYDANSNSPTKVELISVDDTLSTVSSSSSSSAGSGGGGAS